MKIFEETKLGNISLKNRLWRSATWLGMADDDGFVTDAVKEQYKRLSEGGVGNVIVEFTNILPEERTYPGILSISADKHVDKLKELADIIHSNNANAFIQVGYGGSTTSMPTEGRIVWGPSAVKNPTNGFAPVEMTHDDIKSVIEGMAKAALRARKVGFDGVQIHAAHGYLFSQFLSPYFNKRTDEYGGSIENRGRIILESFEAMKAMAGEDFPVLIKMHCDDEWGENGLTVQESLWLSIELEKRGVDAIEFSGGNIDPESGNSALKPRILKQERQSYYKRQVSKIAEQLTIPIILVGGNRNLGIMEEILNDSNISYFSLSRTLHSEPDLPNKWMNNPEKKPRCVACNKCLAPGGNICIIDRKRKK
ncbi:NADH:flavin oxidoreductase [Puteibacter caeruleilacunae]|nr:NADH:flavin oxidoreductase [Puteibacter caeruleilacunae]